MLTADGSYRGIQGARARSWPLAGTQYQMEFTQAWAGLRLSALPTGESRILAYRRIYRSNPWVWACVNALAGAASAFPLRAYGWEASGSKTTYRPELPGRPGPASAAMQLAKLLQHPAPFISRRRTVRRVAVDKLIYGNALWAKEPDGIGGVAAIFNVPWREVSVIAGSDVPVVGFRIMGNAGTRVWALEDAVQFGEGDPDSPIAPSPLEPLQWTIALMDAMSRNVIAFFQNAARPSGVLKMATMPDDRELEIIREQINQLYSGNENSGKPLITSGDWSPMNTGFSYADVVELSKLSREEVAAAYRIPAPVLGILDKAIKSNVSELREQFIREPVADFCSELTDEIDAQLIDPNPAWSGLESGFDMSGRLLPDIENWATAMKELKRVYTLNELRRMSGLPHLDFEWADQPWMEPGSLPANLAPQGASLNPDADPDQPQVVAGDDEANDPDDEFDEEVD